MEKTMRAVRCHRFALVEEEEDVEKGVQKDHQRQRKSFKSRSVPLRLRDCLTLDTVPLPNEYYFNNRHDDETKSESSESNNTKVLIRTEYAGIQYPDALQAQGLYQVKPALPYIPGMDVVGVVVKVIHPSSGQANNYNGNSNSNNNNMILLRPGDRVLATMLESGGTGGMSQFVVVPLKFVYKLPENIITSSSSSSSLAAAAAAFANVGRNYFAAYHSLVEVGRINIRTNNDNDSNNDNNIKKQKQKIVLVTGASGGVGMATIELAKAMGCTVIAGVGSTDKRNGPNSVGADAVFCYGRSKNERRDFRKQVLQFCHTTTTSVGVDLVVDVVMGDLFEEALIGCVKPLGTIALVGFAAGQRKIRPGLLLVKEVRVAGSIWGRIANEATEQQGENNKYRTMVETILGYFANGKINPRVDRIVPLSKFIDAFEVFEVNKGKGNTVV
ncbi:NAD(P)-binding protein, partial [Fragilariopsis cylindrus CCMP1102]